MHSYPLDQAIHRMQPEYPPWIPNKTSYIAVPQIFVIHNTLFSPNTVLSYGLWHRILALFVCLQRYTNLEFSLSLSLYCCRVRQSPRVSARSPPALAANARLADHSPRGWNARRAFAHSSRLCSFYSCIYVSIATLPSHPSSSVATRKDTIYPSSDGPFDSKPVVNGIPQGSPILPALSIIYALSGLGGLCITPEYLRDTPSVRHQ